MFSCPPSKICAQHRYVGMSKEDPEIRVLIADSEQITSERLAVHLERNGFYIHRVRNGKDARKIIQEWQPRIVLCDLMLPDLNAMQILKELQSRKPSELAAGRTNLDEKVHFIVLSGHNNPKNIAECMRLGASDFLVKPQTPEDICNRLLQVTRPSQAVAVLPDLNQSSSQTNGEQSALYFLQLTDLVLREALRTNPCSETLFNLTSMVDLAMLASRVSFVQCADKTRKGFVFAASDRPTSSSADSSKLEINLNKYPEILYVLRHNRLLALNQLHNDPIMNLVTQQFKEIRFNSLIVCPVTIGEELWGVFSVRFPAGRSSLSDAEIRYVQLVAHIGGLTLKLNQAGTNGGSGSTTASSSTVVPTKSAS